MILHFTKWLSAPLLFGSRWPRWLLGLLLLGLAGPVHAQTTAFTVSGSITDAVTGLPVPNVNVRLRNTGTGTTSDSTGNFRLVVRAAAPAPSDTNGALYLVFSSIAYHSQTVAITAFKDQEKPVMLQPKVFELNEFVLTDEPQILYADQRLHIHDYLFLRQLLVVIAYERALSDARLMIINENRQPIATLPIPETAMGLYRDCLDKIYVMATAKKRSDSEAATGDAVVLAPEPYRLENNAQGQLTLNRVDPAFFRQNIAPCIAKNSDTYYYQVPQAEGFVQVYRMFRQRDTTHRELRQIRDQDAIRLYKDQSNPANRYRYYGFKETRHNLIFGITAMSESAKINGSVRTREVADRYDQDYSYLPLYCPLQKLGDRLYLFNHFADSLEVYNLAGDLAYRTALNYHHQKGWQQQVLVDRIMQRAYVVFQRQGYTQLAEIDLATGALNDPFTLNPAFRYAENVKVHGGSVYYLHRLKESRQTRYLYYQRLGG